MSDQREQVPTATQWTLDAVGPEGRAAVEHVYLIVCPKTSMKGTGFMVDGLVVTNHHVVKGCGSSDVIAVSSYGNRMGFTGMRIDQVRDLAVLTPKGSLAGSLELGSSTDLEVGSVVRTWGYPLGYNGPAPLLSVGYLSGFTATQASQGRPLVKHLVANAAFNSGNSGGPLIGGKDNRVVGVVVSKAIPLFNPFVQSAIQAFANNKSGVVFSGTDARGKPVSMVESQAVAEVVGSLRTMAQVMIGEAVAVEELKAFLKN